MHGINDHREKTWTASNGVYWLRDLLPHDIPQARMFSWGYDANTHTASRVSCKYLYDHARALVSDLYRKRKLSNASTAGAYGQQRDPVHVFYIASFIIPKRYILSNCRFSALDGLLASLTNRRRGQPVPKLVLAGMDWRE